MPVLNVVLEVIVPVFGVLGVGYALAKLGWMPADVTRGLAAYTIHIAIPLMLFRGMARTELPDDLPIGLLASYFLSAWAMFFGGMGLARAAFSSSLAARGLFGFGCSYSNLVLVGIPLVLTAWGDAAVVPLFTIVAVHSLLLFAPLTTVLEADRTGRGQGVKGIGSALFGLAKNQYIVAIMAGLAWNLIGLPLPGAIDSVLGLFAQSATPCALFSVGAALAAQRVAGEVPAALAIAALKLAAFPLLVWLFGAYVFGVEDVWLAVAVTVAALPTGINIYLFAEQYGRAVAMATTVTVVSTALSVVTLTVVLTLLGVG